MFSRDVSLSPPNSAPENFRKKRRTRRNFMRIIGLATSVLGVSRRVGSHFSATVGAGTPGRTARHPESSRFAASGKIPPAPWPTPFRPQKVPERGDSDEQRLKLDFQEMFGTGSSSGHVRTGVICCYSSLSGTSLPQYRARFRANDLGIVRDRFGFCDLG